MERLTEICWRNLDPWECCGQDHYCTRGCHDLGGCTGGCIVPKLYARLATYEDSGLGPEEIAALVLPSNAPLTLEELRKLKLREWLWIEILVPSAFRRVGSGYYQVFEDYTRGEALCCGWPGTIHEFEYADYGKTWLAYRHKPEEGK